MSKKLIRKGLAISAAVSLALTGVVAVSAPASAVGRDTGLVRLAPESGTSYKTLIGSSLNLKANFNQTLEQSGTSMKFLVEGDDDSVTKFDIDVNGSTADAYPTVSATFTDWVNSGGVITITSTAHGLKAGDVIFVSALSVLGLDDLSYTVSATSLTTNSFTAVAVVTNNTGDASTDEPITYKVTSANGINTRSYIQDHSFGHLSVVAGNAVSDDRAADGSYVITATDDNASETILRLVSSSADTHSVTVTAWFDEDRDGVIDSTEEISTPQVVTFVKPSEATVTTTLGALSLNDVNLSATVVLADLNMQQLASDISVRFTRNGYNRPFDSNTAVAGVPDDATAWADDTVSYVTLDANLQTGNWDIPDFATAYDNSQSGTEGEDADKVDAALWGAQAFYAGAALGAIDQKSPNATVVNGYKFALDSNANANGATSEDADITDGAAGAVSTGKVRAGTKSFKVTMTLTSNTTTKVAAANIPVSVVVAPTNLATADVVKVNGTAVTTTSKTITGTTNAAGQFVLTVETATGNNADQLVFTPTIQNIAQGALTVAWADASYGIYNVDGETNTTNDKNYAIVVGGSLSLTYDVIDQWGVGAPSGYAVQLTRAQDVARTTATTNFPYRANVSGGKATFTVVDNGTGAGSDTITATVWTVASGGGLGTSGDTQAFTLTYAATAAALTATALTAEVNNNGVKVGATDVYPVALEYKDFVNADTRYSLTTIPAYASNNVFADKSNTVADAQLTLSGKVTNAAGSNVAGKVTISSPGLMFKAVIGSAKSLYATNSITIYTADGNYSVDVYGQATGKRTITVSGAGAAKTVDVTFANAATTAGTQVAFTAPKSIKGGRTLTVSARLTDKFGNPVALTAAEATTQKMAITYDGPGFVISEPTSLTANGTATVRVLLSVGDTGPAIVSFTYTNGDSVVVSGSSATWVGPIANAKAGAKKGRVIVEAYRAKGKTVSVFVGSTRVASFVADKANDSMVVRGIKSGTRNIRVTLSGPGEDFRGAITVK